LPAPMWEMEALKKEVLELLDRDLEFRYAVAGYLGLSEILKRLDALAGEQVRIWNEIKGIREEGVRIWEEVRGIKEEQTRIWDEIKGIREEQVKIWGEIKAIKEEQVKFREEQARLRGDFNKMLALIGRMDARLSGVERTLEKLTIDVEDEARSVLKHRLKEVGIALEPTSLSLPDLEVNLYGASGDVCLIGEAAVRAGAGLADELLRKLDRLKRDYPDRLRGKAILAIYASLPMEDLKERARERGIWLLKATEEFHRPRELFTPLD